MIRCQRPESKGAECRIMMEIIRVLPVVPLGAETATKALTFFPSCESEASCYYSRFNIHMVLLVRLTAQVKNSLNLKRSVACFVANPVSHKLLTCAIAFKI
jgi:hypothetical protein